MDLSGIYKYTYQIVVSSLDYIIHVNNREKYIWNVLIIFCTHLSMVGISNYLHNKLAGCL